ncbi:hypothetical protein [Sphingomonas azotifigens]|uniref:hypothetical protein n=1 Tax=Sphingomonas azotifigens TaxID=330920 RepID=UPI001C3FB2C9|nr:hypothetical protein [Sphingomonas azotifigens]
MSGRRYTMFSAGQGSFRADMIDRVMHPKVERALVFTDTLYEDADAYRFLVEAAALLTGRRVNLTVRAEDFPDYRVPEDVPIEEYGGNPEWRAFLADLRDRTMDAIPELIWLVEASLDLSVRWLRKLRRRKGLRGVRFMLAVQNGMEAGKMLGRVKRIVCQRVGIFIGGDTEWKLATLKFWRRISRERNSLVHCARVNTARRIRACAAAGMDSFDGSSPSIWGKTLRPLDLARQQNDIEGYIARKAA